MSQIPENDQMEDALGSSAPPAPCRRVMIIEPQELARRGLQAILDDDPSLEVVAVCENQTQAAALLASTCPDVVVMDTEACNPDHPQLCAQLDHEHLPLVMVSSSMAPRLIGLSRSVGAVAYVTKRADGAALVRSVQLAASGSSASSFVVGPTPPHQNEELRWSEAHLTPREQEVFWLLSQGMTNRQIANAIGLAEATAKNYACNVLAKLGFSRRVELIPYAAHRSTLLENWAT